MSKKVFVGVGHGGSDSGAVKYLVEKDINLKMALACRDYLVKHGVNAMISRETDKDDNLSDKIARCNKFAPDFALDIHNNAGGGVGFEVYHSISSTSRGKEFAREIESEIKAIGQTSRGLKTKAGSNGDYFGFIRSTNCPAVICEGVFVDNKEDASKADSDAKCKKFGEAYAKGILKALGIEDYEVLIKENNTREEAQTLGGESFKVKVEIKDLNIRKGPGTDSASRGFITPGVYTIVQTIGKWGRLKSGAGWIYLDYAKRL